MDIDDDNSEPPPPGTGSLTPIVNLPTSSPSALKLSSKGVENAKKRLRAFSIQKKTPITPLLVPKPSGSGNTTVVIGKLSSVKITPKPDVESDIKKPPKPPKPGTTRKALQDSYTDLQKKTLSEIEDMKRKMELVELGIPLGLICPSATSEKAMPTKAMPPIKSFLSPEQLDEIIREAKKARAEGRQFKFDYQKLLPDYDNPFQKRKDDAHEKDRHDRRKSDYGKDDDRRRSDKYDYKKHSDYRSEDKHKHRHKDKDRERDRERTQSEHKKPAEKQTTERETDVDLKDFLVCDSWSLDNDDKIPLPSPKTNEKHTKQPEPSEIHKMSLDKTNAALKLCIKDSPKKVEKLKPVIDSFKFEIDPNEDDDVLDIFDENLETNKYAQHKLLKRREDTPKKKAEIELYDKDMTDINEDTFLESVINEIKQENMSDDECEKGLVEYDVSPSKESPGKKRSATPDIIDLGSASQRSDRSGYTSTDSYRTTGTNESGYKSVESSSFRLSPEKELNASLQDRLSRPTVDSLETWSFVLKICQPLLFRHDKNKCYKETHTTPKIWYTENPKRCMCVKDRAVVYEELEMCKMNLVDRVYGCDQIPDAGVPTCRNWYARSPLSAACATPAPPAAPGPAAPPAQPAPLASEWDADDSQHRPDTPRRSEEVLLDREYQRFMEAVESKVESSRSTTPVQQEAKKKRKDEVPKEIEEKKLKKLNNEDWSQESDIEMEVEKTKKLKEKEKSRLRKRKHSSSTQSSVSESEDSKKKNKALKKKALKKVKSKSAKKRRIGKKILKKLKEQEKKKKKYKDSDDEEDKKKDKKTKKKKLLKAKKKLSKKKKKIKIKSSSSSSSSSSDTDSESDSEKEKKKKAKKKSVDSKKKKSKKRKQSTSDSTQSEELFDVNILNNIKTERLTDDDFSPRRQKPREIINVKELQNDFVGNNIEVKKEIVEQVTPEERVKEIDVDESSTADSVHSDTGDKACEKSIEKEQSEAEIKLIPIPEEPKRQNERDFPEIQPPEDKAPLEAKQPDKVLPEVKTDKSLPQQEDRTVTEAKATPEDSNISQSSQDSVYSVKEPSSYEKDDSYLRPSSQNSNYNFHDVIASHAEYKHDDVTACHAEYKHDATASQEYKHDATVSHDYKHDATVSHDYKLDATAGHEYKHDDVDYEAGSYEMYEQLAMAYQSDVADQLSPCGGERRIETVVHARCGEIKCDWRPGDLAPVKSPRPSRWGLKPSEVNIVLTGGGEADESPPRVFPIQSLANRDHSEGYDEAYLDMYGAADRLQYGDCFSEGEAPAPAAPEGGVPAPRSSLDVRIDQALRTSVLGEVAKETDDSQTELDKATNAAAEAGRGIKRVSFADGYKPGQDSDVEEPPVKKRKRARRVGCAWPCPATHADHVPLWDALPPPPPPPGSPPRAPPAPRALLPPALQPHIIPGTTPSHLLTGPQPHLLPGAPSAPHLLPGAPSAPHMLTSRTGMIPGPRMLPGPTQILNMPHALHAQFDPNTSLPGFLPPEPPPGLIALR